MKKSVKLVTAAATAMMLGGGITPTLAGASTNANVSTNVGNNVGLKLQSFDQYIYVKNNEFILSDTGLVNMNSSDIIAVRETLNSSNQMIKQQHGVINPETKEVMTITTFVSGLSTKWFWWGERYYFTSNAAVANVSHRMRNQADTLAGLGVLGTVLSSGTAAVVGGSAAIYFNNVANNLDYYNSIHIHSHIYMDMGYSGYYTLHTF